MECFMRNKLFLILFFIFLFLLLPGCTSINESSNLKNDLTNLTSSQNYEKETAFHAYIAANEFANQWNENAEMTQIIIGSIMAKNIGIPPSKDAWYFMYKTNENSIELYIEVIDGKVTGYTEAQPIITDNLRIPQKPIIINDLIDSNIVINLYTKNNSIISNSSNLNLELALHYIDGHSNPVWSVFELSDNNSTLSLVFRVDAKTQEILITPNNS